MALAGTLNLPRAVGRVHDLAVPGLARWACVVAGAVTTSDPQPRPPVVRTWPLLHRGAQLGTLELAWHVEPDAEALARAAALAGAASVGLHAARVHAERAELVDTLRSALLPPSLPTVTGLDLGARYRPTREASLVGGDFYDVWPLGGDEHAFLLGDVSGKGVAAAVLTGQVRQSLRTAAAVLDDPAESLALVDRVLRESDGTRFATAVHGRVRSDGGGWQLRLAGAGHPSPLHLRGPGQVTEVPTGGTLLGMLRRPRFTTTELRLAPGESMVLWTDGLPEARAGGAALGDEQLHEVVADSWGLPAQVLAERLEQTALEHLAGSAHDDLAVLVLRAGA